MSDEGGVTPSDEMLDISPLRVTPEAGKGALGTWRFGGTAQDTEPGNWYPSWCDEPACKPSTARGVYESAFKLRLCMGRPRRKAKVRTGLGKSDRPG